MSTRTLLRRQEAKRRGKRAGALHLVSLMDIFTILVFFLLVNSSDVEILEVAPDVRLPDSSAESEPRPDVVVSVSNEAVRVNGEAVVQLSEVLAGDDIIGPLVDVLRERRPFADAQVTVMADRGAPYALLRRILATCEAAQFVHVAFAVNQQPAAAVDATGASPS